MTVYVLTWGQVASRFSPETLGPPPWVLLLPLFLWVGVFIYRQVGMKEGPWQCGAGSQNLLEVMLLRDITENDYECSWGHGQWAQKRGQQKAYPGINIYDCMCWDMFWQMSSGGVQPFSASGPHWKKKSCLGPHIKYTNTNKNWWAKKRF